MSKDDDEVFDPIVDGDFDSLVNTALTTKRLESYPKAIRKGNFKEQFGFDVDCYVLNTPDRTAVISQKDFILALGYTHGGGRLRSLKRLISKTAQGAKLAKILRKPLIFNASIDDFSASPLIIAQGVNAELLIDICKEIIKLDHEGKLHPSQKVIAEKADLINTSLGKLAIKQLVYAVAGYDATKEESINYCKAYIADSVTQRYISMFPEELYAEWCRLFDIAVLPRGRSWHLMHLTMNHIYRNVAKSKGKITELLLIAKEQDNKKKKRKLHELLHDGGKNALRETIALVYATAKWSKNAQEYEARIKELFGDVEDIIGHCDVEVGNTNLYILISSFANPANKETNLGDILRHINTKLYHFVDRFRTLKDPNIKDSDITIVTSSDVEDLGYQFTKTYQLPYKVKQFDVDWGKEGLIFKDICPITHALVFWDNKVDSTRNILMNCAKNSGMTKDSQFLYDKDLGIGYTNINELIP